MAILRMTMSLSFSPKTSCFDRGRSLVPYFLVSFASPLPPHIISAKSGRGHTLPNVGENSSRNTTAITPTDSVEVARRDDQISLTGTVGLFRRHQSSCVDFLSHSKYEDSF